MAKVTLAPEFESLSGKLCSKSKSVVAVNKKTGKMYRYDSHPGEQPNSEKQQQVKTTFTQKAQAASQWWAQNKPVKDTRPDGTALYQQLMKQYDAQRKIGNPYSYLRSLVQDDLTIQLGGQSVSIGTNTDQGSGQQPGTGGAPSLD